MWHSIGVRFDVAILLDPCCGVMDRPVETSARAVIYVTGALCLHTGLD
jgi:hypothetical protein